MPRCTAGDLASAVGASIPTAHRLLAQVRDQVVSAGKARRTRYALRRPLRGRLQDLPLFEVDALGRGEQIGTLACVHPQGTQVDWAASGWATPEDSRDGWWDGLPYPLYDMRPQGYMGRQFARAHHRLLGVPDNPAAWGDDDVLHVLSHAGHDAPGSLILGNASYEQWLGQRASDPDLIPGDAAAPVYATLAEQAVSAGVPGSSAAGEFPKFAAMRSGDEGSTTPHVLVKFSGAEGSAAVGRWADLLVCEHLALATLQQLRPGGVTAAASRVLRHGGRTFLEVERFDRHGLWGRSRLCSLEAVNGAFLGAGTQDWSQLAARLEEMGLLPAAQVQAIEVLWWFGRLTANTDMHLGNLSFRADQGVFTPAPAYDMLPMLYAPLAGGEVPPRTFTPPLPMPAQRPAWLAAAAAALAFWQRAADEVRLSDEFRRICSANQAALKRAVSMV